MALKLNAKMAAFIFNNGGEGLLQSQNFNKCSKIDFTKRKASISRKSTSPKVGCAVSLWILWNHLPPLRIFEKPQKNYFLAAVEVSSNCKWQPWQR